MYSFILVFIFINKVNKLLNRGKSPVCFYLEAWYVRDMFIKRQLYNIEHFLFNAQKIQVNLIKRFVCKTISVVLVYMKLNVFKGEFRKQSYDFNTLKNTITS